MTPSPRFAAFDLDGTLIDSAQSIVDGVVACWAACGFPDPDPIAVKRIIGLPWEESIRTLLPGSGEREFNLIRGYYDDVARAVRGRPPTSEALFDGARELLDRLADAGYVLGIVTSRNARRLGALLDGHEIAHRFSVLRTPDHGPGKPDPYLLLQAMSAVGASPVSTVMIGDTTFDMLMAGGAGAASIGVSWGVHDSEELERAGADRVVHVFDRLAGAIDELTGPVR